MLFDSRAERLAVGGICMIFCGIIGVLLFLLVASHSSQEERHQLGHTIRSSVEQLDSTVQELVIDNRVKARMLSKQSKKTTGTDSAYQHLRIEHRRLELRHRATQRELQRVRKQLDESVRRERVVVPVLPRISRDSTALPAQR